METIRQIGKSKKFLLPRIGFWVLVLTVSLLYPANEVRAICTGNELIWSLAVNPTDSNIVYLGTDRGIVYVSLDGGSSCYHIDLGLARPFQRIYALALDPTDPSVVYAGTSFTGPFTGLFKSTDYGAHWSAIGPTQQSGIRCLLIDPNAPGTIYAGSTTEQIFIDPEGMFKSLDGGDSWFPINTGLFPVRFNSLAMDPNDSNSVYAASVRGLAESGGLSKTTNGGDSWFRPSLTSGYAPAIVTDPYDSFTVYYIDSGYLGNYLQKSTNGGASWFDASVGLPRFNNPVSLAIDPFNPNTLYLGTDGGIYKTVNGGQSWFASGLSGLTIQTIAIAPNNPNTIYVGTKEQGGLKSTDGGRTWFDI